jgi:hypothetical protein
MARGKSDDDLWREFHFNPGNPELQEVNGIFHRAFPQGHRESIKHDVEKWGQQALEGKGPEELHDTHPRALAVIATYGRDYTPWIWPALPSWGNSRVVDEVGTCYENAAAVMNACIRGKSGPTCDGGNSWRVYVEGIVSGVMAPLMLHAWNSQDLRCGIALDWTHYGGCDWTRYLGVPITPEEHEELWLKVIEARAPEDARRPLSLFRNECFPIIEERLTEMLKSRSG